METPPYQYQPLQHSESVRMLILYPSPNESEPIECAICHEDLSDGSLDDEASLDYEASLHYETSLHYEAVSYTWGDSGLTHRIYCNAAKHRLSVGRNCHAALRRLRLPNKRRKLWIDAVCINQDDVAERGHQVRMMKEVYDRASGVMIMLADEIPKCRLLLHELAEANNFVHELARAGSDLDSCKDARPFRHRPGAAIVRELETMFEDSWFKRAWVLQEVHGKDLVTIVYGSTTIPFEALHELQHGYSGTSVTRIARPLPLRLISGYLRSYTTSQFSLWNRLYWSRECLATDPRDNVFALKSLLGSRQAQVDHLIDYAQSVEECFKRVATFLLPVLALRILAATRHPHELDMASWIPDWSQTLPLRFDAFNVETLEKDQETILSSPTDVESQKRALLSYSYKEDEIGPTLCVDGCWYACIVECSQVLHFVDLDDVERQMLRIFNHIHNLRLHLDEESKIDNLEAPGHFSGKVFNAMSCLDGKYLHSNLTRLNSTYLSTKGRAAIRLQDSLLDFYEALQDCSIALLSNGGLAIVPGTAEDGEVVCILAGAIAPCLLGQYEDGSWMLVSGDCHIFGLEPSSMAESDAYVDSHQREVKRFMLV